MHRFLTQVVVDPIDLRFVEIAVQEGIRSRGQWWGSEWLLKDHTRTPVHRLFQQAGLGKAFDRPRNSHRRQGQIQDAVFQQIEGKFHLPDVLTIFIVFGFASTNRLVMKILFITPATQIRRIAPRRICSDFRKPKDETPLRASSPAAPPREDKVISISNSPYVRR